MTGEMKTGTCSTDSGEPRDKIIPPTDCGALPDPTAYYDEICLKAMGKLDSMLNAGEYRNAVYVAKVVSALMHDED